MKILSEFDFKRFEIGIKNICGANWIVAEKRDMEPRNNKQKIMRKKSLKNGLNVKIARNAANKIFEQKKKISSV